MYVIFLSLCGLWETTQKAFILESSYILKSFNFWSRKISLSNYSNFS